ncbi:MAG: RNA polymerase sigma factor [Minisyncoccia bacterium]
MKDSDFEAVFEEYADSLFRHAYFRVGSREKARDMAQDTFIKAWDYANTHDDAVREWKPLLYRILNNLIIDEYRKKKSVSLDAIEEAHQEEGAHLPLALQEGGLEEAVAQVDLGYDAQVLQKALVDVSMVDRQVLTYKFIDERTNSEIADLLSISPDAVYVRVHRAIKNLRSILVTKYGFDSIVK